MIAPGATIGIIGGGQLGRLLAQAAAALGYRAHIYTPEQDSPAAQVAAASTVAGYENQLALEAFARSVDVVTFEFENIPPESLELLAGRVPVAPSAEVLKVSRNRLREKRFVNGLGIPTAPFRAVTSPEELGAAAGEIGFPCILKTTEMGYDGKGQLALKAAENWADTWNALATREAILEGFVDFECELSVIVARGEDGVMQAYCPVRNIHKHHILDRTIAPAGISEALSAEARAIASRIAEALELRGLLAVELFLTRDGRLLVNELAPRPHNSGHWTLDACVTSQFEQAIRAVCGLPLGNPARLCDAEMRNLIGEDARDAWRYLEHPNDKLHLYGKTEIRAGRKMGHVTRLKPRS